MRLRGSTAVRIYVVALAAAAIAAFAVAFRVDGADLRHDGLLFVFLTALFAAVEFAEFSFHSREGRVGLSGSEAVLYPMIVALPPALTLAGAAIGVGIVQAVRRRGEPLKAAFNVAQFACAAGAGAALFRVLGSEAATFTVRQGVAAAVATFSFTVITHVLTLEAIALSGGHRLPRFDRDTIDTVARGTVGGIGLGLVFAAALAAARWTVVLFPLPLVVLYRGARALVRQSRERERVEALHSATRALAASADLGGQVTGFLEAVASVVAASRTLVVVESGGQVLWSEVGPDGVVASMEPGEQRPPHHLLAAVKHARGPILVTEEDRSVQPSLTARMSVRNIAAVPLLGEDGVVGCLAAANRVGADEFDEAETELLGALAGELVITLDAHRLFDEAAEHRERFQRIFEDGPLGMAIVDRDLRMTVVNKALGTMLGYGPAELAGSSVLSITHPDDGWSDLQQARRAFRGEIPAYQIEKRYLAKDGSIVFGTLTATVVRDARGEVLYGLHIVEDITDRKRADDALRAYARELAKANRELRLGNELKDHFLAVTNHELRTPLTSIVGFATMLEQRWDGLPEQDRRDFIGRIHRQATRLAELIDDLLTLSSAEAGALELKLEPVDLRATIQEAVRLVTPVDGEIVVRCPDDLRVQADAARLFQILSNYLSNALRHGAPPVSVGARVVGHSVEIRVTDSGPGVPPDFVGRLFDKFAQADRGIVRSGGGTGLGLAIVRELAHAQGGTAWYEPARPTGATFCLRLPLAVERSAGRFDEAALSGTAG